MKEFLGRAVENGVLRFTSVSALAKFNPAEDGCNGKWWYRYVAGIKEPKKKSAELGDRLHKQLEHYNLTGQDVLDPILRAGLHLIPLPDLRRIVAPEINLEIAGVRVVGAIDLLDLTGDIPEVIDYKTTSNIRSYAKPASKLIETTQMPVYAFDVILKKKREDERVFGAHHYYGPDHVRLTHIYFQTTGRLADSRSAVVGLTDLERRFNNIQSLIGEMKAIAKEPAIDKVPLNEAACDSFGGCPYRDKCPRKMKVGRVMNLFNATLQQRKAAVPTQSTTAAAEVPASCTLGPTVEGAKVGDTTMHGAVLQILPDGQTLYRAQPQQAPAPAPAAPSAPALPTVSVPPPPAARKPGRPRKMEIQDVAAPPAEAPSSPAEPAKQPAPATGCTVKAMTIGMGVTIKASESGDFCKAFVQLEADGNDEDALVAKVEARLQALVNSLKGE